MELAALTTARDKEQREKAANEVATRKRLAALQGELDNARQARYAPCVLVASGSMRAHRACHWVAAKAGRKCALLRRGGREGCNGVPRRDAEEMLTAAQSRADGLDLQLGREPCHANFLAPKPPLQG